ncbi:MAG: phosphate ABC transporter permease subunit PstC [Alphaproteobacteria bacterium]
MHVFTLIGVLLALALAGYHAGRSRALSLKTGPRSAGQPAAAAAGGGSGPGPRFHSLPDYHGYYTALWTLAPPLLLLAGWLALEPMVLTHVVLAGLPPEMEDLPADRLRLMVSTIRTLAVGVVAGDPGEALLAAGRRYAELRSRSGTLLSLLACGLAVAGLALAWRSIAPDLRARNRVEAATRAFMVACSAVAIITTVGIVASLLFESLRFFAAVPPSEFLFGLAWSPQTAIRADQVGSSGAFGAVPLFTGTLLISGIALAVAVPTGLMSAIFTAEYAGPGLRAVVKPLLEILAGIPTVVYGFFAALVVGPFLRDSGGTVGLGISSESALAAGVVMGIMIVPFVSSLSDDVISAVPESLREGSLGLGATRSETIRRVVLPAALPGIVGGVLLAASRAIGETMIVVMAAGMAANLTANPFEAVTTVTVQIVSLLVGDQEFDSPKTLAAFALGLVLFVVTLLLNVVALHVVRKYRERYE